MIFLGVSEFGAWSGCSATCGDGTKTRSANCIDGECDQSLLNESANCRLEDCKFKLII